MLFGITFTKNFVLLLHFILTFALFVFLARSGRLNAKLAPCGPTTDYTPVPPRLPDKKSYRKMLDKKRKEKTLAAAATVCCWLEIGAACAAVILKNAEWLLRQKLRLLPNPKTGVRISVAAVLLQAGAYILFYRMLERPYASVMYAEEITFASASGWLPVFFGLLSTLLASCFFLLLVIFFANREFYFDFFGVQLLLFVALTKLLICANTPCCFGIPFAWGLYNENLGMTVFPIQLFESGATLLGVVLCVVFMLFAKSYRPGRGMVLALAWFATYRFAAEFFRYSGAYRPSAARRLYGLSVVHLVCAAAFVVAVAALFLLPIEKRIFDRISSSSKAFWARRIQKNVSLQELRKKVLMNCPARFRRQFREGGAFLQ
ncbi:MAG: prolipoprotein diacylglyceryl transferase [Desulfovibrionaceae bacterium]|nr:prolipoprotein diacylglyceryl transferase [Desulfovibrionaceae bacterium]